MSLGIQNSPGLARRKPQAHLKNNILPSKPWNTRDMLANLPNINSERGEELDSWYNRSSLLLFNIFSRVYQSASNSNSRPNSRPQSPAMGIRDTLELGSPRRQLSRRSRSNSLDSFSEELLGLSGGSLEYQNELCPDRQCVYSPKGKKSRRNTKINFAIFRRTSSTAPAINRLFRIGPLSKL